MRTLFLTVCLLLCFSTMQDMYPLCARVEACCDAVGCGNNSPPGSSDSSSSIVAADLEADADFSCVGTMAAVALLRGPDFCHPEFVTFLASNEVMSD